MKKTKTTHLNVSDEELARMRSRSPETKLNWLDSAVKFVKTKKKLIKK